MATTQRRSSRQATTKRAQPQGSGLMKAVQPSAELAAIVGNTPLPRTEITKRLWDYIKEHGLQDARNKRMINADAKLRPVLGGQEQVSMFDLPKLVSHHVQ
jgi:upstream activation factor subunit UAF30